MGRHDERQAKHSPKTSPQDECADWESDGRDGDGAWDELAQDIPDSLPEALVEAGRDGKIGGGACGGYMQVRDGSKVSYGVVEVPTSPHRQPQQRPARLRMSSFGNDEELAIELPPGWTLKKFQEEAKAAVDEYFLSRATTDTVLRIQELLRKCPSEADEFGVIALRAAVDKDAACQEATVKLLCELHRSTDAKALDKSALVRSFEKLFCAWEDITIDAPKAPEVLLQMLQGCISGKVVNASLLTKLPENLLNAGLTKAGPEVAEMLAGVAAELRTFKKEVSRTLEEYFVAQAATEVETFLGELGMPAYHHEFVKKVITLSFTQNNVEAARETAVALLTQLTAAASLSKDDLQWGVTRLLGQLDDLELDCPRSAELAKEFLVAMVADELVSVPFLRRCRLLRIGGASGVRVVDGVMRRTPEYSKKHLGTTQFKQELQTTILEYFHSKDEAEFGRCVSELAPLSTAQSSELVRKVMAFAIERSGDECVLALRLLVWLCRHEELDEDKIEAGFDELYARMPDLLLDVPDAREMARTFVVEAKKEGLLRDDWQEPTE